MDTFPIGMALLIVLCITPFAQLTQRVYWDEVDHYEIYKATLPFGIFLLNGEISGGFFLFSGYVSGSVVVEEHYLVKYFKDGELRSADLEASEVPIVIDGTLRLEKITTYRTGFIYLWKYTQMREISWKLHIPYLPRVNQTLTEDWIK